ncbi:hypothetical protein [Treponema pedis]|uniref:Lipoprotein n=2 Tax=Treponema pedis TaxID=409322 RepID=S6A089_9SPIR|nr:hypothetical protein [Treponema pedis]AGT44068.1 hypothetical protein TPE_1573 [Treponema pedis str. T A4]QOW61189.1 hypothetical protein IFE08_01915 [Treponema pedis]
MKNIVFIITVILVFMSCSIKPSFISNIETYGYVDLQDFIKDEFDYLLIVDEGNYISDIIPNINNDRDFWLGQKIYFVKNDFIVKQINIEYYVSKPEMDYISFFLNIILKKII